MNIDDYRSYCLAKEAVSEEFPFDDKTLVYKVAGKMFALTDVFDFEYINVKCDPEKAIELRAAYPGIRSAWHMNKKHWNSIYLHEGLAHEQIYAWIDHSYDMVVAKFSKKERERYLLSIEEASPYKN